LQVIATVAVFCIAKPIKLDWTRLAFDIPTYSAFRRTVMKYLFGATAIALAAPLAADHWRQTADPQVVFMFDQLMSFYGMNCQMGDQNACAGYQAAGQQGMAMLNASYDCATGNAQACQFYQQSAMALMGAIQQVQQFQGGGFDPNMGNPLGATHADRMAAIESFGAANTATWQDRMAAGDASHNAFIEYIQQ
jgi:hypothetical protein